MAKSIFVNLPVKDLKKSKAFWESLGFSFNAQFTDDTAACLVLGENICAMLLTHPKFSGFMPKGKTLADAHASTEVLIAIDVPTKAGVDELVKRAVAGGGKTYNQPQDHGFMYAHAFQDLDGHCWEPLWLNPEFGGEPK